MCLAYKKNGEQKMTRMLQLLCLSIFVNGIHKTGLFSIVLSKKSEQLLDSIINFKIVAMKAQPQLTTSISFSRDGLSDPFTLTAAARLLHHGQERRLMRTLQTNEKLFLTPCLHSRLHPENINASLSFTIRTAFFHMNTYCISCHSLYKATNFLPLQFVSRKIF